MNSIQKTTRMTGIFILIMAVIAPFGMLYVSSTLIVPGDAATTANQIRASESVFEKSLLPRGSFSFAKSGYQRWLSTFQMPSYGN